jgi:Pyruvate/2-oxoacid:ferredoxin oxidoreductase gamma subunit
MMTMREDLREAPEKRGILLSGIGGQGIQIASQILASGLTIAGRSVLMFGMYEGERRGGKSECQLLVSDDLGESGPITEEFSLTLLMHPRGAEDVLASTVPGGVIVYNSDLVDLTRTARDDQTIHGRPLSTLAKELGSELVATLVGVGLLGTFLDLPDDEALRTAVDEVVPPHRTKLVEANRRAIRCGWELATGVSA